MKALPESTAVSPDRWTLIRDVAVLQVKLLIDGVRDLVLVPASLIAGLVSLVRSRDGRPGPEFYNLINIGRQSEHWINLFGAMRNAPPDAVTDVHFADMDLDDIVSRVEHFVVDEYRRGGVTAQAKARMDQALRALRQRRSTSRRDDDSSQPGGG
jgi:hypothetical protein